MSNTTKPAPFRGAAPLGEPLSEVDRDKLRVIVGRLGEARAAELLGVARHTLARALAGLGVRRGTAVMIRRGLDALAAEPERRLVIVEVHDARCAVCSRPFTKGSEAVTWHGSTLAHTGCVDLCGGPRGL